MTQRRLRKTTSDPAVRMLTGESGEIWQAYVSGVPQTDLAEKYGITPARVSQIVKQARESLPQDTIEEVTADTLALIRGRIFVCVQRANAGEVAWERALNRWVERYCKILGLDQPIRIRAAMGVEPMRYIIEMDNDIAEAMK